MIISEMHINFIEVKQINPSSELNKFMVLVKRYSAAGTSKTNFIHSPCTVIVQAAWLLII